jgi:hypothetical protein
MRLLLATEPVEQMAGRRQQRRGAAARGSELNSQSRLAPAGVPNLQLLPELY